MKIVEGITRAFSSRCCQMLVFLAMYALLAVEYYRFVYLNYYYLMGFDYIAAPVPILVGLLMLAVVTIVMFGKCDAVSGKCEVASANYAVSMIVALLFCLPSIVMYQFGRVTPMVALYSMLFLILLRTPLLKVGRWNLPHVPVKYQRYLLPTICLLCLLPFPLAYGLDGIDLSSLTMGEETYDVRAAVSERETLLTSYLMGPLYMVLLPMLIVYGLTDIRRNWWMSLVGIASMLFLFLLNTQKSIFFGLFVVLAMYAFKNYYAKAGIILYGLAAACLVSVLLNIATGHLMAESIVVRRLFFIPVIVGDNYFTFFDGHPMLLSHSVLGHWVDYPYQLEPSRMIGEMMYNRAETNCNTGIVGDGFMNFGHVGAALFVAAAALFVRCVEGQMQNARFFGLAALLVYTFLNSALLTTLLTHGGLVLLAAVCFLIPEERRAAE